MKIFGGVCFLLNGNLLVGVWKDSLIARVGKDAYDAALQEEVQRRRTSLSRMLRLGRRLFESARDQNE